MGNRDAVTGVESPKEKRKSVVDVTGYYLGYIVDSICLSIPLLLR